MDFSGLTNSIHMNRIDQISVTFFNRYSFITAGKISELGRRRFIDNLFYSLANCSNKLYLIDKSENVSYNGSISQLSDIMTDHIEQNGNSETESRLNIEFTKFCLGDSNAGKLIEMFPFIEPYLKGEQIESIQRLFVNYLSTVCQNFKQENNSADVKTLSRNFKYFLDSVSSHSSFDKFNDKLKSTNENLSSEISKFKAKLSSFFPISTGQSLEEISYTIEKKLKTFYTNLDNISKDITSLSKNSNFSKLKNQLDLMQNALNTMKNDVYQPKKIANLNGAAPNINEIHFEDKNYKPNIEQRIPFFSFYRVKSIVKAKRISKGSRRMIQKPSLKSIRTFEYGFSELGSSDSISYYICDHEGNSFSNEDEFSEENSARLSRVYPTPRMSEEMMIKKNQSMNQFPSKDSCEEKFTKTILYDDNLSDNKKLFQESIVFGLNDFRIKNLDIENGLARKCFDILGIDLDEYIDKNGIEWKACNEQQLEQKIKYLVDLEETFNTKLHENVSLIDEVKCLTIKVNDLQKECQRLVDNDELSKLKKKHSDTLISYESLNREYSKLKSDFEETTRNEILRKNHLKKMMLTLFENSLKPIITKLREEVSLTINQSQSMSEVRGFLLKLKRISQESYDRELQISALDNKLNNTYQDINNYKIKNEQLNQIIQINSINQAKWKLRMQNVNYKAEILTEDLVKYFNTKVTKIIQSVAVLKSHISNNQLDNTDNRKTIQVLETDNSDLKYINGNLLKELQILSTNQQNLSREKENLEEQIKLKEELEEKNREMTITIKMLEEKLEMSNSLREMAEQKFIGMEENESPFEKYTKSSNEKFNHDYNFNRHLGTIDENEELIEISETHEQSHGVRDTHQASATEDKFRSLEQPPAKNIKLEIVKSYSLKFGLIAKQNDEIELEDKKQILQKSSSMECKAKKFDFDVKSFKGSLHQEKVNHSDNKADKVNGDESEVGDRHRHNRSYCDDNKNAIHSREKRSSGKKSLFSMENVLKSIGEVNKAEFRSSIQKQLADLNITDETKLNLIPRGTNLRTSLNEQEDWQLSRKNSDDYLPREKRFTTQFSKFDKRFSVEASKRIYDKFQTFFASLITKYESLHEYVIAQNDSLDFKVQSIQSKLINVEVLQNIQSDILSQPREKGSVRSTIVNSPKNEDQMSLTERMKKIHDHFDSNNKVGTKLFAKNTNLQMPNLTVEEHNPKSTKNTKSLVYDSKFGNLQKNYGNTAVKNKSFNDIDDKVISLSSNKKANYNKIISNSNVVDKTINKKIGYETNDKKEKYPKHGKMMLMEQITPSNKLSTPSHKSIITPNSSKNFESLVFQQKVPENLYYQSEKGVNQLDVENPRRVSELSNGNNDPEFELVEKQIYKNLIDNKKQIETQYHEMVEKYHNEKAHMSNQLNDLRLANDSLKIESIKLYGENERLNDDNQEYKRILERAFEAIRPIVDDTTEMEIMMKPEYIDKILEMVRERFDNFQTIVEAMDEEIKLLKNGLFASDNQINDNYMNSNRSIRQDNQVSIQPSEAEIKLNNGQENSVERSASKLQVYDVNNYGFNSKYESNNPHYESNDEPINQKNHASKGFINKVHNFDLKKTLSESENIHSEDNRSDRLEIKNHVIRFQNKNFNTFDKRKQLKSHDKSDRDENQFEDNSNHMNNDGVEDENVTSFSHKQRILKEGFYELLNNIMGVIEENKSYISKAQIRMMSSNSQPILDAHSSKSDLRSSSVHLKSFTSVTKDIDLIKNNNLHLKEMVEFLTKNLMMFLEELEELKLETNTVHQNAQFEELLLENEFLYKKLNEAHREIESYNKYIEDMQKKYPQMNPVSFKPVDRFLSLPAFKFEEISSNREFLLTNFTGYKEKINDLLQFKNQGYTNVAIDEKVDLNPNYVIQNEQKSRTRIITEKASITEDQLNKPYSFNKENDNPEQEENNIEEYNIFLLNILRQIKLLIDDNTLAYAEKLVRLEEISKDLDIM